MLLEAKLGRKGHTQFFYWFSLLQFDIWLNVHILHLENIYQIKQKLVEQITIRLKMLILWLFE